VTQPFHSSLDWGDDSITRYAANQTLLRDYDISPKIAHSFSPNFHLAGGININYLAYNEMNWSMPSGATTYAKLTNKTSSTGIGFNVGLSYIFNPMNIFGLSYYSQIRQNSSGYSEFNGTKTTDHTFHFHFPSHNKR
jgi:long-subunit fatty acid transport protein